MSITVNIQESKKEPNKSILYFDNRIQVINYIIDFITERDGVMRVSKECKNKILSELETYLKRNESKLKEFFIKKCELFNSDDFIGELMRDADETLTYEFELLRK